MNEDIEVLRTYGGWEKVYNELRPHFYKITNKYLKSILKELESKKVDDFKQILRENEGDFYDQIVNLFGGERLKKNILRESFEVILNEAYRLNMIEDFIKIGAEYFWYYCLGEMCISIQNQLF